MSFLYLFGRLQRILLIRSRPHGTKLSGPALIFAARRNEWFLSGSCHRIWVERAGLVRERTETKTSSLNNSTRSPPPGGLGKTLRHSTWKYLRILCVIANCRHFTGLTRFTNFYAVFKVHCAADWKHISTSYFAFVRLVVPYKVWNFIFLAWTVLAKFNSKPS